MSENRGVVGKHYSMAQSRLFNWRDLGLRKHKAYSGEIR